MVGRRGRALKDGGIRVLMGEWQQQSSAVVAAAGYADVGLGRAAGAAMSSSAGSSSSSSSLTSTHLLLPTPH